MKHSDRAFSLAEHYRSMKSQGIRKDLVETIEQNIMQKNNGNFTDNDTENSNSVKISLQEGKREKLAKEYGLDSTTISKYIRIADLEKDLLYLLDEGHIAFAAAYQFTFITDTEAQKAIAKVVHSGVKILAAKS